MSKNKAGTIAWVDLTVEDAGKTKDFYQKVVGWESSPVNMGDYDDFAMIVPGTENAAAGICNLRGSNKDIPSQWMIYIIVDNLLDSIEQVNKNGGKVVAGPKNMGSQGRYAVVEDPAGAVCALYEEY